MAMHGKLLDLDRLHGQSKIELFSILCYLYMDKVEYNCRSHLYLRHIFISYKNKWVPQEIIPTRIEWAIHKGVAYETMDNFRSLFDVPRTSGQ